MPELTIVQTDTGRALDYNGEQAPMPALPVDATVHAYQTPQGLWAGVQAPGTPRPVYAGSGGQKLGTIELEADPGALLAREREHAIERINDAYTEEMEAAAAEYPKVERESWGKQEDEAKAWKGNGTAPTPFIDGMLKSQPGKSKQALADKIAAKADALADLTGQLTGKRHDLEEQIEAATDVPTVGAITW